MEWKVSLHRNEVFVEENWNQLSVAIEHPAILHSWITMGVHPVRAQLQEQDGFARVDKLSRCSSGLQSSSRSKFRSSVDQESVKSIFTASGGSGGRGNKAALSSLLPSLTGSPGSGTAPPARAPRGTAGARRFEEIRSRCPCPLPSS